MKITIITVSFNCVATIENTIKSILQQSYKNIEYIIIDGNSSDGTLEIIKKYGDCVNYISEPDDGIYDAMNKGIEKATGDYIQFLGADDYLVCDDIIEKIVEILKEKNPDALSTPIYILNEKYKLQKLYNNHLSKKEIFSGRMIPHPGLFVKNDIMKTMKFDTYYRVAGDFDFILRFLLQGYILEYGNIITVYFSNAGISSTNLIQKFNEHIRVMKNNHMCLADINKQVTLQSKYLEKKNKKNYIKNILEKFGLLRFVLNVRGWEKHKCNNIFCRWCKNTYLR